MAATITPFTPAEPSRSPHSIKYSVSNDGGATTAQRTLTQMIGDLKPGPLLTFLKSIATADWGSIDRRAEFSLLLHPNGQTLPTSVQAYFIVNGASHDLEVILVGSGSVILELRFHPTAVR